MDAQNQFSVFLSCVAIGAVGGLACEPFMLLRVLFGCERGRYKFVGIFLDAAFFVVFTVWTVFAAYRLHFPNFRIYMWLGYALGGIIYSKTLRKIIAFFENMCYNKLIQWIKRAKKAEKTPSQKVEKIYDTR